MKRCLHAGRYLPALALLALALLGAGPAARAQASLSVPDAGFETPGAGGGFLYGPVDGAPWTFAGSASGASGLSGNGSGFTSFNPNAPEGSQVGFVQDAGVISEPVAGFQAGVSYVLTVSAARRADYSANSVQVSLDGVVLGTITQSSDGDADTDYQDHTLGPFTAPAGTHTLAFAGLNTGADCTMFLDNVRITTVPALLPPPGSGGNGTAQSPPVANLALTDLYLSGAGGGQVWVKIEWDIDQNAIFATNFSTSGTTTVSGTHCTYVGPSLSQFGAPATYSVEQKDPERDPPPPPPGEQAEVINPSWSNPASIRVTPEQAVVTDNQSVDARYDPRYATWTFVDHNFGATAYRGGLFAGYNADNAQVGHAYLKFALPPVPTGRTLWGVGSVDAYFTRLYSTASTVFPISTVVSCQTVPSAWAGAALTWDTAPAFAPASATAAQQATVTYDGTLLSAAWAHWGMGADIVSALTGGSGAYAAALGGQGEPAVGPGGPSGAGASGWAYFAKRESAVGEPACVLYAYSN